MPFPPAYRKIYQFLYPSRQCHGRHWNVTCIATQVNCNEAAEKDMKIYLLILLIGALLTAVHFTSAPEKRQETQPQ